MAEQDVTALPIFPPILHERGQVQAAALPQTGLAWKPAIVAFSLEAVDARIWSRSTGCLTLFGWGCLAGAAQR